MNNKKRFQDTAKRNRHHDNWCQRRDSTSTVTSFQNGERV